MNSRDLPEIVGELTAEMHEVRSELSAFDERVDRVERTVEEGFRLMREKSRQNTDHLVEAFSRSMGQHLSFIERHGSQLKNHGERLGRLENTQA